MHYKVLYPDAKLGEVYEVRPSEYEQCNDLGVRKGDKIVECEFCHTYTDWYDIETGKPTCCTRCRRYTIYNETRVDKELW